MVFAFDVVVFAALPHETGGYKAAAPATARRGQEEKAQLVLFVVVIFLVVQVLVLDVVAFAGFARETQAHQAAASTSADRSRQSQTSSTVLTETFSFF